MATCILPQCLVICSRSDLTGRIDIFKSTRYLKRCDSRELALVSPPELMVGGAGNRSVSASKPLPAIMPNRKRRRSVAFAPDDDDTTTRDEGSPIDGAPEAEGKANSGVWDAFCEEYHEGIGLLLVTLTTDEKKCWSNSRSHCNAHSSLSASWTIKHSVSSRRLSAFMLRGLTNEKPTARLWLTTYVNISKLVLTMVALGEDRC